MVFTEGKFMEQAESKEKLTILLFLIVFVLFLFIPICVKISLQAYVDDTSDLLTLAAVVPLLTIFICRIHQSHRYASEVHVRRYLTWMPLKSAGMIPARGVEFF
jgi:ABC-type uncharacterized transport system permease subunit